jgi:hypothetical protein
MIEALGWRGWSARPALIARDCSMNDPMASPDELYRTLALRYGLDLHTPRGRGFGSDALKVDGKIFASLSHGRLLVKLPAERVKALVEAKLGEPFRPALAGSRRNG